MNAIPQIHISPKTCVDALAGAMLSRRSALQAELAVGLIIFAMEGEANRAAKQMLNAIYADAGYQCLSAKDIDYKTVNRRINVTASLFEVIGLEKVAAWLDSKAELQAISAIITQLEPLQFFTINDVLAFVGKPAGDQERREARKTAAPQNVPAQAPEAASGAGNQAAGPFQRRAEDRPGAVRIDTNTLHLSIPPDAKPSELIEVAMRILALAREKGVNHAISAPVSSKKTKELEEVF